MMNGSIRQCVSLPQSICEYLRVSFVVQTAGSLRRALRSLGVRITMLEQECFCWHL